MVVRTAMLGNIKNPPEPFENVIRTHFRLKARSVSAQLDKWLAEDDGVGLEGDGASLSRARHGRGGGSDNGFKKDIEDLKALLVRL
jgi:hypothetical protein